MNLYRTVIASLAALSGPTTGPEFAIQANPTDDEPQLAVDFRYLQSGNCYAFTPATPAARKWARGDETMTALGRMGSAYVVEKQDFGTIVDLIDAAGFYFTKGA